MYYNNYYYYYYYNNNNNNIYNYIYSYIIIIIINYIACFYLVYFEEEHCVSIVASKRIITSGINEVKVGDKVQIKERGKVYDGTIASYGELI